MVKGCSPDLLTLDRRGSYVGYVGRWMIREFVYTGGREYFSEIEAETLTNTHAARMQIIYLDLPHDSGIEIEFKRCTAKS